MASSRETFVILFWIALGCGTMGLGSMILAFATPYWIQSWRRVHSPFANTGMWTICLSGYIKPRDPKLEAYVGCWWIHTSVFHDIANAIMPPWFRIVQTLVILTLLCNLIALVLMLLFRFDTPRQSLYGDKPWKTLFADSILLFAAGCDGGDLRLVGERHTIEPDPDDMTTLMVFIDSLMFAMKTTEAFWMPRPFLNYLSWSFGFNVLSGFFSAFAGICAFLMAMMVREGLESEEIGEKEEEGADNAGVTATPPPPKLKSMALEGQPMPRKLYDQPPQFQPYQDYPPEVHPYSDRPVGPATATYAYQRKPIDSTTDTEV